MIKFKFDVFDAKEYYRIMEKKMSIQEPELSFGDVHVIYGNGKNKTTTANGYVLRALGAGASVLYVQFLKNGTSSELNVYSDLKDIGYSIDMYYPSPTDFVYEKPNQTHVDTVRGSYRRAAEGVEDTTYDMVVCDEILYAYLFNLVCVNDIRSLIQKRHGELELILTGNTDHEGITELSDYVSHLTCIEHKKHPFYTKNQTARKGIEY
jgi:cob(I)alamin adenosyltransferase